MTANEYHVRLDCIASLMSHSSAAEPVMWSTIWWTTRACKSIYHSLLRIVCSLTQYQGAPH